MEKDLQIKVFSRQNVEKFLTDLPHIVISVRDPGSERVNLPDNPNRIAELYLDFNDIDCNKFIPDCTPDIKTFSGEDAASILKVVGLTYPYINLIVVNCEAGISRSAGIAGALSVLLGIGDEAYFTPKGPYSPNRFVYRTLLNQAILENFHIKDI
jgi:predicted protein tyrosine phosphatase